MNEPRGSQAKSITVLYNPKNLSIWLKWHWPMRP